jgi:molybdate transport system substrate-binding protein
VKPILHLSAALLSLVAAGQLLAGEIMVFAAASLTDSLKETAAAYEKSSGDKVQFNFAGSNTLAQQIQAGAPADIFFSADGLKMDALEKAGLIVKDTRKDLLGNTLVIITAMDGFKVTKAEDLASAAVTHLSLADPKAVPAGIYAKTWLESVKLWDKVESKVVPAENVRAAMAVVESGNAEAGIVYKTDAAISKKVTIALEIAAAEGPKITYPVALAKDSRNAAAAKKFLVWLAGKEAAKTFRKFGFSVIE